MSCAKLSDNTYICKGCSGNYSVWGTNIYTSDSHVCSSAKHAGAIPSSGGTFRIIQLPGQSSYQGSTRNGITSYSYNTYPSSYRVEPISGHYITYKDCSCNKHLDVKCAGCSTYLSGTWHLNTAGYNTGAYLGINCRYYYGSAGWVYCYCESCYQKQIGRTDIKYVNNSDNDRLIADNSALKRQVEEYKIKRDNIAKNLTKILDNINSVLPVCYDRISVNDVLSSNINLRTKSPTTQKCDGTETIDKLMEMLEKNSII